MQNPSLFLFPYIYTYTKSISTTNINTFNNKSFYCKIIQK